MNCRRLLSTIIAGVALFLVQPQVSLAEFAVQINVYEDNSKTTLLGSSTSFDDNNDNVVSADVTFGFLDLAASFAETTPPPGGDLLTQISATNFVVKNRSSEARFIEVIVSSAGFSAPMGSVTLDTSLSLSTGVGKASVSGTHEAWVYRAKKKKATKPGTKGKTGGAGVDFSGGDSNKVAGTEVGTFTTPGSLTPDPLAVSFNITEDDVPFGLAMKTTYEVGAGRTLNATIFQAQITPTPAPSALILALSAVPFVGGFGYLKHRRKKKVAPTEK